MWKARDIIRWKIERLLSASGEDGLIAGKKTLAKNVFEIDRIKFHRAARVKRPMATSMSREAARNGAPGKSMVALSRLNP